MMAEADERIRKPKHSSSAAQWDRCAARSGALGLLRADSVAHVDLAAALDDLSATERPELR
jgi:hypothetical protein